MTGGAGAERRGPFRWREATRWFALLVAVALAWPNRDNAWSGLVLPALSPLVALGSIIATRTVGIVVAFALPVALLALLVPRGFCHYVCPVGFLQERLRRVRPAWPTRTHRAPRIGRFVLLVTVAAACFGYPVLLWLDPLALFQGGLNAWRMPITVVSLVPGAGLAAVLLIDFMLPGVWCGRLCPLGAMQDLLAWPRRRAQPSSRFIAGRREFLAVGGGVAAALAARRVHGSPKPPLRPPGSLDESRFAGVCIRCGNCTQACPSRIIRPDRGMHGVLNLFTPVLSYEADYCREGCNRCNEACPSGAIARLPLAEKKRRIIGVAQLDLDCCLLANGRECTACIRKCPFEALAAQSLDGGFTVQPVLERAKCNGCGACESVCPVRPVRAIRVDCGVTRPA